MRTAAAMVPLLFAAGCGCNGGSSAGDDSVACNEEPSHTGDGTYYDADGTGACSFDPSPGDLMVAAANPADFAGSAACGACAAIDGPSGSVTVRIVDLCPGCATGDLDLSPQAFTQIADLAAGRVPITWQFVPCAVDGPVRYRFKEGSNAFWAAVQVRNHLHAVAMLEARAGGGAWHPIPRESYNYFVDAAGFGAGTVDLRVTDVYGHTVEDLAVPQGDGTEASGSAQLDVCR